MNINHIWGFFGASHQLPVQCIVAMDLPTTQIYPVQGCCWAGKWPFATVHLTQPAVHAMVVYLIHPVLHLSKLPHNFTCPTPAYLFVSDVRARHTSNLSFGLYFSSDSLTVGKPYICMYVCVYVCSATEYTCLGSEGFRKKQSSAQSVSNIRQQTRWKSSLTTTKWAFGPSACGPTPSLPVTGSLYLSLARYSIVNRPNMYRHHTRC